MENKKGTGISVILPVHELNDETKKLFSNAVQSVINQTVKPDELIIVVPKNSDLSKELKTLDYSGFNVVIAENDGNTDFASQVNYGVSVCKSEWFSILELDDEYAKIGLKMLSNIEMHIQMLTSLCLLLLM